MYQISYRILVLGWSAKPLVSAHDRIMGTHRLDAARQREPQLFAHWHLLASTPRRTVGAV